MSQSTSSHPLQPLLETQRQDAARMLEVLEQELRAIKSNDLTAFEQSMDTKTRHISHLEQQAKIFQPTLEKIVGTPCGKDQLATYIDNSGDSALQETWQNLRTTLKCCYEQNLLNRRVLDAARAEVQQALNILRGETQANPLSGTYKDSGKTDLTPPKGQSIGVV